MSHRSPARFLAPLAILGVALALFVVVSGSNTSDEQEASSPASNLERAVEDAEKKESQDRAKKRGDRAKRKTYTVQAGDTPSGIAEKTDVPLERIEELNPDLNAQTLNVGDKIRIR